MKHEQLLTQIKKDAGFSMVWPWAVTFAAYALLIFGSIFLFPVLFHKSAGSSKIFGPFFASSFLGMLVMLPLLYIYGYTSKRRQVKCIKQRLDSANHMINYYKRSIQDMRQFFLDLNVSHKNDMDRISRDSKLQTEDFKQRIIQETQAHIDGYNKRFMELKKKIEGKLGNGMDDEISGLESKIEGHFESVTDKALDMISDANKREEHTQHDHEKSVQYVFEGNEASLKEYTDKMQAKIDNEQHVISDLLVLTKKYYS